MSKIMVVAPLGLLCAAASLPADAAAQPQECFRCEDRWYDPQQHGTTCQEHWPEAEKQHITPEPDPPLYPGTWQDNVMHSENWVCFDCDEAHNECTETDDALLALALARTTASRFLGDRHAVLRSVLMDLSDRVELTVHKDLVVRSCSSEDIAFTLTLTRPKISVFGRWRSGAQDNGVNQGVESVWQWF